MNYLLPHFYFLLLYSTHPVIVMTSFLWFNIFSYRFLFLCIFLLFSSHLFFLHLVCLTLNHATDDDIWSSCVLWSDYDMVMWYGLHRSNTGLSLLWNSWKQNLQMNEFYTKHIIVVSKSRLPQYSSTSSFFKFTQYIQQNVHHPCLTCNFSDLSVISLLSDVTGAWSILYSDVKIKDGLT